MSGLIFRSSPTQGFIATLLSCFVVVHRPKGRCTWLLRLCFLLWGFTYPWSIIGFFTFLTPFSSCICGSNGSLLSHQTKTKQKIFRLLTQKCLVQYEISVKYELHIYRREYPAYTRKMTCSLAKLNSIFHGLYDTVFCFLFLRKCKNLSGFISINIFWVQLLDNWKDSDTSDSDAYHMEKVWVEN